jgi:hypothetical protein
MKKAISEQIEQMLDRLMSLSPDDVEAFFLDEWKPFIESLPSESAKILALEKLWKRQVDNLSRIASHVPAMSDESFEKLEPQLQGLVSAGESLRAKQRKVVAAT